MTKREFLDTVFALAPNEANKIMDAFDEYVESAQLSTNLAEVGTDLISRQDALEAFGLSEKTRKYGGDHSGYDTMMMYEIQDTIEDLPPIQPKRGKWIRDGHHIRCDQCGMYMCDTDREGDRIPTDFCPNCGAKMEVEHESN